VCCDHVERLRQHGDDGFRRKRVVTPVVEVFGSRQGKDRVELARQRKAGEVVVEPRPISIDVGVRYPTGATVKQLW